MSLTLRLSLFYASLCLFSGIYLPFYPVWLKGNGLGAEQISFIIAAMSFLRIISAPGIAFVADRVGDRRRVVIALGWISLGCVVALCFSNGFMAIFLVSATLMLFLPAISPLAETMAMRAAIDQGINYGRVRIWCSITFIVASSGMGWVLEWQPSSIIVLALVGSIAINLGGSYLLSRDLAEPRRSGSSGVQLRAMWQMARHPLFLTGIMSASLIQSGHAVYYAFGTLNWVRLGYSETTIGFLWALGVIAEIALFFVASNVVGRLGAPRLMMMAAAGGILRWGLMALNPPLWGVICLQLLHAASFGAAHLAALHFVAHAAPRSLGATAQGLYSSLSSGLMMGGVTLLAGPLYVAYHEKAYFLSAFLCLLALIGTFIIAIRWDGGALIAEESGNDNQGSPYRGGAGC